MVHSGAFLNTNLGFHVDGLNIEMGVGRAKAPSDAKCVTEIMKLGREGTKFTVLFQ